MPRELLQVDKFQNYFCLQRIWDGNYRWQYCCVDQMVNKRESLKIINLYIEE